MLNNNTNVLLNDLLERVDDNSPILRVVSDVKKIIQNAAEINVVSHTDTDETKTEELQHTYLLRLKRYKNNIDQNMKGFSESCENLGKTSAKLLKLIIIQTDKFAITIWYSNTEIVCCFYRND